MSDTSLDQSEEILSYEISDEGFESAAGAKRRHRPRAHVSIFRNCY